MDILIIRFSSLGDVVMASAAVEALNSKFPEAGVHVLTKNAYVLLFEGDEHVEKVVGIQGQESPFEIVRLLGRRSFDAVIDLHGSLRSRIVTALVRSPLKLRVNKHSLARRAMVWSRNRFRRSFDVLGNYLETLSPLGISGRVFPRLVPDSEDVKKADGLLRGLEKSVIGLAPGSKHPTKRWSGKSYASLADNIARNGFFPVFIGDENDVGIIERIREQMAEESLSLAGKIDLAVTTGVISCFRCLVTNDSGPMHIAGALGTPFVAIFGPTHPNLGFVPGYPSGSIMHSGVLCSPCSIHGEKNCRMKRRLCMEEITGEMVMGKIVNSLDSFKK